MATTINATTPSTGWSAPRVAVVKVNRFWPNTASVRLVAPPVKLKKVQAFEVLGWDPDDGDVDVPISHSQTVNFSVPRSNALSYHYDQPVDFLVGDLTNLELAGSGIQFEKDRRTNNFDQYPVGGLPSDFTQISATGVWQIQQEAGGNRKLRGYSNNYQSRNMVTYDVESSSVNLVARVKMQFHTADYSGGGVMFRATGSGVTFSAYSVEIRGGSNQIVARRWTSSTSETYLGQVTSGVTCGVNDGYWYNIKAWMDGNNLWGKSWREDQAEPANWLLVASDSVLPGPGEVGLVNYSRYQTGGNCSFDDMSFENVPTTYKTSGSWLGELHPLVAVDLYSQSVVTWDETIPADTSIIVECQRDVGAPWLVCTNGEPLPGFTFDDGLKTDRLRFRVTFSSTDNNVTPEFWNLRFEFIRLDWDLVEIVVGGHSARTFNLGHWGQLTFVSPNVITTYDDIWVQNYGHLWFEAAQKSVQAEFKYNDVFIEGIQWTPEWNPSTIDETIGYSWVVIEGDSQRWPLFEWACIENANRGEALAEWAIIDKEPATGGEIIWALIDGTPGLQATGHYWVAVQTFNEFVSSQLNGFSELNEFVASLIVDGYLFREFVSSSVVQGSKLDEFVSSILPAIEFLSEFPSSQLNGLLDLSEFPSSHLVYGVYKDGAIFINLIDDETYQKLLDSGVVFS